MEIKDIVGLSQPLTKLIEVVSCGIGHITKPYFIRKTADAKAYEIERIAKAIEQNNAAFKQIEYDDTKIKLLQQKENLSDEAMQSYKELADRATQRVAYRETKRQINVENTIAQAAEELSKDQKVSKEPLNEDWINRYFNIIEDISSEEMQNLWGKILAGEIRHPSTYSLRTLDVLRNISSFEAEVFCRIAAFALSSGDKAFIMYEEAFLENELGIKFTDLLLLKDLGLMFPTELEFSFSPCEKETISHLIWGKLIIVVRRDNNTPKIPIQAAVFTQTGKELLNLVEKPMNELYLKKLGTKLKINNDVHVFYGYILSVAGDSIHHTDLIEITCTE